MQKKLQVNRKITMTDFSRFVNQLSKGVWILSHATFFSSRRGMSAGPPAYRYQDPGKGCVIPVPGPDVIIVLAIGVVTVAMALIAVLQKNLIRAVIAFAISSAGLAALFFLLASPYAGALELTVGAGLVAVLLLVALVLAGGEEEKVST